MVLDFKALVSGGVDESDAVAGVVSDDFELGAGDAEVVVGGDLIVDGLSVDVDDAADSGAGGSEAVDFDRGVFDCFVHLGALLEVEIELVFVGIEAFVWVVEGAADLGRGMEVAGVYGVAVAELVGHLFEEDPGVVLKGIFGDVRTTSTDGGLADLPHIARACRVDPCGVVVGIVGEVVAVEFGVDVVEDGFCHLIYLGNNV